MFEVTESARDEIKKALAAEASATAVRVYVAGHG